MNTYSADKIYESYSSEVERMQKCIDELQQENNELKKHLEESKNLKNKLLVYNASIKHNWNALKEYIETIYKSCPPYEKEVVMFIINKIKELESSDSDE